MGSINSRILIFIDWFLPGYKAGGPIKSVANVVFAFSEECDFWIVTGDRDLGDNSPYHDVTFNQWVQREHYRIMYLSPDRQNKKAYQRLLQEISPDTVYCNSMFSYRFTILPMLAIRTWRVSLRTVVAPRGMLGAGCMEIKTTKKLLFLKLCRLTGLFKHVVWQASSDTETQDIKKYMGKNAIVKVAMNLSNITTEPWLPKVKATGRVDLFFVSRICKVKNLLFALKCLSAIKETKITYYIIGTVEEPDYWQQCQSIISQLPENIKIEYLGQIENHKLHDVIKHYHFLLFPTLHENYGHVIAESLQVGCPVIISDRTPWQGLEEKGVGWDIPLDNEKRIIQIIEHCAMMDQEEYHITSKKAYLYAQNFINNETVVTQNRELFNI